MTSSQMSKSHCWISCTETTESGSLKSLHPTSLLSLNMEPKKSTSLQASMKSPNTDLIAHRQKVVKTSLTSLTSFGVIGAKVKHIINCHNPAKAHSETSSICTDFGLASDLFSVDRIDKSDRRARLATMRLAHQKSIVRSERSWGVV